jgi:large subunit ribosomal protein L10
MARPEKESVVREFEADFQAATAVYVADYKGMTVEQISELRAAMRAERVKIKVAKNTLVRRAARAAGYDKLSDVLNGPNAFIFGFDDPVAPARIIRDFKKKSKLEKPAIGGFILDGNVLPGAQFEAVASLPSKQELVAKVVGSVQAPLANFVFTLQAILREFVGTVTAIAEKKEEPAKG